MAVGAERVAQSWLLNQGTRESNMRTNGSDVYSYEHRIGITNEYGVKIAYRCRYSHTTAIHANVLARYADEWQPCPVKEHN